MCPSGVFRAEFVRLYVGSFGSQALLSEKIHMNNQSEADASSKRTGWKVAGAVVFVLVAIYLSVAYIVLPYAWEGFEALHPALDDVPGITETAEGIPGDPLNVALIAMEEDLKLAMRAAGWYPADALSLRSDVKIAEATVLSRPYDEAPVSSLYLWGRKEDLAFEKPVGENPRQRNHVRFWRSKELDEQGRPLWMGSATYDERVGLSKTTDQITHHIAPDVDTERGRLFDDLESAGELLDVVKIPDFHEVKSGRNGGGDPWRTDGALWVGVVRGA